ncbi:MAG: extracellular solute-binding protein [Ruminococcaceae bacterium]|nr:extracellular solute-binding protein [Oscillospiraceae bacterium]
MFEKTVKICTKFLCLLLAVVMVAGCSGDSDKTDKGSGKDRPTNTTTANGVNPEEFRGTTVVYATWKDPYKNEDGKVIDKFKKKYGIDVKIDMVPQDTYVQEVAAKIVAGNSPDVFFDNCFFPASLAVLQPLEAMKLDTNDDIWDQGMFEMSTFGGKPFLANTVGNIWAEVDCLFYNKKIFKDNNITTPEEYYEAGKWNFAALTKAMTDVKNAGYIGGYIDVQSLLASTGSGFYNFKDGKFSNGVNEKTTAVITQISQWVSDGLIKDPREYNLLNNFIKGNCGIAITNAYGMKATGYFADMNPNDIGFTYIPKFDDNTNAYTTGLFRGWGLVKGAKNPVAAGIFLRYYLDVSNYDLDSAFINKDAQNFFFKLTSGVDTNEKNPYMLLGITQLCSEKVSDYTGISGMAPGQVSTQISSISPKITNNANVVNQEIEKNLKALGLN